MEEKSTIYFKSIALVELYDHSEVLRTVYELLEPIVENLLILTKPTIKADLELVDLVSPKVRWYLIDDDATLGTFLTKNQTILNQCDWVFLLTINRPFSSFVSLKCLDKTLLLIHNVHTFLAPWQYIDWSWPNLPEILLRQIRFWLGGDYFALRELLMRTKVWAFPNETVLTYALANQWIPESQARLVLPLAIPLRFPSSQISSISDTVRICIPGTIKSNGRDYEMALSAFQTLLIESPKKIHLCLLGQPQKPYGRRIQKAFDQLTNGYPHFSVKFYEQVVPQVEYDRQLLNTDFLLLPLKAKSRYDGFRERVSFSTISGGVNDMIRLGKPTLLSACYKLGPEWEGLVATFNNEAELVMRLREWIQAKNWVYVVEAFNAPGKLYLENKINSLVKVLSIYPET